MVMARRLMTVGMWAGLGAMAAPGAQAAAPVAAPVMAADTAYLSRVVLRLPPEVKADTTDWAQQSYLELAAPNDMEWSLKINAGLLGIDKDSHAPVQSVTAVITDGMIQAAAQADAVLSLHNAMWSLSRTQAAAPAQIIASVAVAAQPRPAGALRALLGYDAVVVRQDGVVVTAQTPDLTAAKALYAVALADSQAVYRVEGGSTAAKSALLQLESGGVRFSTFKVTLSDTGGPLPVGTKLRLEQTPSSLK